MNDNDEDGPRVTSGTNRAPCLHCILNRAMDTYNEAQHRITGQRVNTDDNIDDLIACVAELIAMYDDAKVRKFVAKREASKLIGRVRHFREIGRYPGGPGTKQEPVH